MSEMNDIIIALKDARKAQGVSQTELGARIGVPQSHISKIEKGRVDLQLSSLTQIARALDFELQLVPKKALPAVQSIIRATHTISYRHGQNSNVLSNYKDENISKDFLASAINHVQRQISDIESGNSLAGAVVNLEQQFKLKESQFKYLNNIVKNSSNKIPRPAHSLDDGDE